MERPSEVVEETGRVLKFVRLGGPWLAVMMLSLGLAYTTFGRDVFGDRLTHAESAARWDRHMTIEERTQIDALTAYVDRKLQDHVSADHPRTREEVAKLGALVGAMQLQLDRMERKLDRGQ
jgi:hypothetical protein